MARCLDRLDASIADQHQARLHAQLTDASTTGDLPAAVAASNGLINTSEALGAEHAVTHLRNAAPHAFTLATHPGAGRLLFGDKTAPSSPLGCSNESCAR